MAIVTVYRIECAPDAPRLIPVGSAAGTVARFGGERKAATWPQKGLPVSVINPVDNLFTFYRFALGALAYPEEVITECDDFYWVVTQNIEPLHAVGDGITFNVANVTAILEKPKPGEFGYDEGAPCSVHGFYAPLFRIRDRDPAELFCISGLTNPLNEFKGVYDRFRFSGLEFTEIWTGER